MKPSNVMSLAVLALVVLWASGTASAAMTSTNFEIRNDSFGAGGEDTSSSASYRLRDSVGVISSQGSSSASYSASTGYRSGIFDPSVDFNVFIQDRTSQVAATALLLKTVTVTSAAGMQVGDMIAIVQNEGAGQVTAIGEIVSIGGSDVTLDYLHHAGVAPAIDGANDYVYVLDGSVLSLGTLNQSIVSTAVLAWEANVDTDGGYSVYVYEDTDLTDGSDTITDVADGEVTAGASEYGGRSSDTTLATSTFDTADTAFTTTPALVGSREDVEFKSRDFITVKASIDGTEGDGAYSHTLTVVYVGDY